MTLNNKIFKYNDNYYSYKEYIKKTGYNFKGGSSCHKLEPKFSIQSFIQKSMLYFDKQSLYYIPLYYAYSFASIPKGLFWSPISLTGDKVRKLIKTLATPPGGEGPLSWQVYMPLHLIFKMSQEGVTCEDKWNLVFESINIQYDERCEGFNIPSIQSNLQNEDNYKEDLKLKSKRLTRDTFNLLTTHLLNIYILNEENNTQEIEMNDIENMQDQKEIFSKEINHIIKDWFNKNIEIIKSFENIYQCSSKSNWLELLRINSTPNDENNQLEFETIRLHIICLNILDISFKGVNNYEESNGKHNEMKAHFSEDIDKIFEKCEIVNDVIKDETSKDKDPKDIAKDLLTTGVFNGKTPNDKTIFDAIKEHLKKLPYMFHNQYETLTLSNYVNKETEVTEEAKT